MTFDLSYYIQFYTQVYNSKTGTPCCSFSPSLAPIESWGWATWTLDVSLTQDMDHPCQQHTQSATLHSQYSSILHCHHHHTISVKSAFHWSRNNTPLPCFLTLSLKCVPIPEQSMSVTRSKHTENRKPHSDRLEITMATWQDVEKEKMRVRGAEGNGNV